MPRSYLRTRQDRVLPLAVQDRMIAEADALSPANRFDVHTIDAGHLVPIIRPAETARILSGLLGLAARTAEGS